MTHNGPVPRLTLIAALGRNRVIGRRGEIPWRLEGEQAHFKATTMGHVLVMGRATFDSIGRVLPGRRTIVLTRNPDWSHPGVETAQSLPEAIALAGPGAEIFVAGGGQVYAQALPLADRLVLSEVDAEPAGDAFFPVVDSRDWVESSRMPRPGYTIVTYDRVAGRARYRDGAAPIRPPDYAAMMPITYRVAGSVATITIERPERRNALNAAALDELDAAIGRCRADDARALVLTGAGGHFCAGADLTELEDVEFTQHLAGVLERLSTLPITTVAAISGSCMGLGMQLAIACDVRVVADDARFAVPVAKLGLMVDYWTLDRVRRFWGEGAARLMALTATVLTADDAWRLGFAQARGDLAAATELAASAVGLAPLSQAGTKIGFDCDGPLEVARYDAAFARAWASEDLREGRAAFNERRPPKFTGH